MSVGLSSKVRSVCELSITKGLVNWYRVVRSSRIIGTNRPAVQRTEYGSSDTFAFGREFDSVNRVASSRAVSGGFVGTSHASPQARSVVAAVTNAGGPHIHVYTHTRTQIN